MRLSEFKAWFDGFTETMDGAPNEKQWVRIKEKIALISNESIACTWPVYVDRYVRPWWGVDKPYRWTLNAGAVQMSTSGAHLGAINYSVPGPNRTGMTEVFDVHAEMRNIGRKEFALS